MNVVREFLIFASSSLPPPPPPPPLSCSDLLLSYYQRNTYNVKTGIVHMFLTTILIIRPLVVTPRSKPPVKRILSQFCASSGSQKFNQCSSPEQSQFLRFYAVKCRKWISSSKISLCITHRWSEIVLFGSYFIPALGFSFILLFIHLTFLKVINFQMWLIKSSATSWVTLRKGSQLSFKSHHWQKNSNKAQTVADLSDLV